MIGNERVRYQNRLDDLFRKMPAEVGDELLSHWARYLCVLTCGFIEVGVAEIFMNYSANQASPRVVKFVNSRLAAFQNPKHAKIEDLVGCFDANWREGFKNETAGEIKDHVDGLIANRNNIAHGQPSGVTVAQVRQWYESSKKLITYLENMCSLD